jgi:hypothetical protein
VIKNGKSFCIGILYVINIAFVENKIYRLPQPMFYNYLLATKEGFN